MGWQSAGWGLHPSPQADPIKRSAMRSDKNKSQCVSVPELVQVMVVSFAFAH